MLQVAVIDASKIECCINQGKANYMSKALMTINKFEIHNYNYHKMHFYVKKCNCCQKYP